MPKVSFVKESKYPTLDVATGQALMWALVGEQIPVASACHGKGVCSKCKIKIVSGASNLSPETQEEKDLRERNKISSEFRISCQAKILGDISIDTDYW